MTDTVQVRPVGPADLPCLLRMNNTAVPAVNALTLSDLEGLVADALVCLVAVRDGQPAGFLLCLAEGTSYDSRNYLWMSARYPRFVYTDRICVDAACRGLRIGETLYQHLFELPETDRRPFVCEVNERPPNPGSLRFHTRLGFTEVGRADRGDKAVVFLERPVAGTQQ